MPQPGTLINETASYINGQVHCRYSRMIAADGPEVFTLNAFYYLLLGFGPAPNGKSSFSFMVLLSSFYASFYWLYALESIRLGKINNPIVTLKLIFIIALPCLLYAQEALANAYV